MRTEIRLRYWFKNAWMRNYIIDNATELGLHPCSKIVKVSSGYYADIACGAGFVLSPTFTSLKDCKSWVAEALKARLK